MPKGYKAAGSMRNAAGGRVSNNPNSKQPAGKSFEAFYGGQPRDTLGHVIRKEPLVSGKNVKRGPVG